jgi:hypothetical protein
MEPEDIMSLHIDIFFAALFLSWGKAGKPYIWAMLGFNIASYYVYKFLK